jgi:hypothetical protein
MADPTNPTSPAPDASAAQGNSSVADYLKTIDAHGGQIDEPTRFGMFNAIAAAGDKVHTLEKGGKQISPEDAIKYAHDAVAQESTFLQSAGTRGLVDRYLSDLITRSEKLDDAKKQKHGTHLREFLEKTGGIVNDSAKYGGLDYATIKNDLSDKTKMAVLLTKKDALEHIENDIHDQAAIDIDPSFKKHDAKDVKTLGQDFIQTARDHQADWDKETNGVPPVTVNKPSPIDASNPLMLIILVLVALLGGSMGNMFGAGQDGQSNGGGIMDMIKGLMGGGSQTPSAQPTPPAAQTPVAPPASVPPTPGGQTGGALGTGTGNTFDPNAIANRAHQIAATMPAANPNGPISGGGNLGNHIPPTSPGVGGAVSGPGGLRQ